MTNTLEQRARELLDAESAFVWPARQYNAALRAIEAALRLSAGADWQPIETAPKDGVTQILLYEDGETYVGVRPLDCPDDAAASMWTAVYPTHWQPLPAAPRHETGKG